MPKYDQMPTLNKKKLLLVGDPGSGKTGLLASLANAGYNVNILNIDDNLGIMDAYLTDEGRKRVSVVTVQAKDKNSWKAIVGATEKWDDGVDPRTWDTNTIFVVDSATFANEVCMQAVMAENNVKDDGNGFDQRLWGVMANRFENLVARLTSDKYLCHVILIAHMRLIENKKLGGILKAMPAFLGQQLPNTVPRYCNNVWLAERDKDSNPILTTQSNAKYSYLKCSTPHKITATAEFDLGKLFKEST